MPKFGDKELGKAQDMLAELPEDSAVIILHASPRNTPGCLAFADQLDWHYMADFLRGLERCQFNKAVKRSFEATKYPGWGEEG